MVPLLAPGAHMVTIMPEASCIEGRQAGLELRDTLLILSPGPRCRFAFLWRAPLNVAVVEQVAKTGTGGINVDACRIETSDKYNRAPALSSSGGWRGYESGMGRMSDSSGLGRWPPNVLLVHGPACSSTGTRKVRGGIAHEECADIEGVGYNKHWGRRNAQFGYVDSDGLETIPSWSCELGCPVGLLDAQAGLRPSTLTGRADPSAVHENPGDNHGLSLFGGGNSKVYADQGGASRFFPQFANDSEMLEWFKRLLRTKA